MATETTAEINETELRRAHANSGIQQTFEEAMNIPALRISIQHLASRPETKAQPKTPPTTTPAVPASTKRIKSFSASLADLDDFWWNKI